jgi:hypothetical protein
MYKFLIENLACVRKIENHSLNMGCIDQLLEGLTEFLINSHWLKNVLENIYSSSCSHCFSLRKVPVTHQLGGWMDPIGPIWMWQQRENHYPCLELNPDRQAHSHFSA